MEHVQSMNVLCLAGGGGQQSAVFSLLGSHVTVLDLTPEQLERDRQAADHYGYRVTTIQGDMRDLSALPGDYFDRVYQPISTLYIPDLQEVYAGVARVLKPGGLYLSDYAVPLLYMAQDKGWDSQGYTLYVIEPYIRGAILETGDGDLNFSEGTSFSEFHHLLSDIINGLIARGLSIRGLWENPGPDSGPPIGELEPGSDDHKSRYLPFGLRVIAQRSMCDRILFTENQQAKDLVHSYFDALINKRDLSICDRLLAPDFVDHDAPPNTPPGPESIKAYVSRFLDDHPDMRITVKDVIAEGNKVAAHLVWKGINRHTGEPFHQMGIITLHIDKQGRFTERWSAYAPVGQSS
jgi:predicted SnoaL-like aldol condensation-catalyzing enzyme